MEEMTKDAAEGSRRNDMSDCTTCAWGDTKSGKGKTFYCGKDSIRFESPDSYFCMKDGTEQAIKKASCPDYISRACAEKAKMA